MVHHLVSELKRKTMMNKKTTKFCRSLSMRITMCTTCFHAILVRSMHRFPKKGAHFMHFSINLLIYIHFFFHSSVLFAVVAWSHCCAVDSVCLAVLFVWTLFRNGHLPEPSAATKLNIAFHAFGQNIFCALLKCSRRVIFKQMHAGQVLCDNCNKL